MNDPNSIPPEGGSDDSHDDDSHKWDALAKLLGTQSPPPEAWDRPRTTTPAPSADLGRKERTDHASASHKPPFDENQSV